MSIYLGAGNTAHQASKLYVGVGGQARQVQKMYVGIGGQARLVYQNNTPIGSLSVGSTVKIKVNGVAKDFIVVHQGLPGSIYNSSCTGTWLLMKDVYTFGVFGNNNSYEDSNIHSYLNSTFLNLIDADIRNAIKQVKIPYWNGAGSGGSLATGASGLGTKMFLLSAYEVGWTISYDGYFPQDGVRLAYFSDGSGGNSKRIAYNGSSAAIWWLRSPYTGNSNHVWYVDTNGSGNHDWYDFAYGIRPAMILSSDTLVDESGNVIG